MFLDFVSQRCAFVHSSNCNCTFAKARYRLDFWLIGRSSTFFQKVVWRYIPQLPMFCSGMPHPLSPAELSSILLRAFKIILFELKIKKSNHTSRTACKKFEIVCSIITQDFLLDWPDPKKQKQFGFYVNHVLTTRRLPGCVAVFFSAREPSNVGRALHIGASVVTWQRFGWLVVMIFSIIKGFVWYVNFQYLFFRKHHYQKQMYHQNHHHHRCLNGAACFLLFPKALPRRNALRDLTRTVVDRWLVTHIGPLTRRLVRWQCGTCKFRFSNETRGPGCLGYIGDYIQPLWNKRYNGK